MMLMNQSPISDIVQEGEFNYYIYEVTCDDCGVVFNLASLSTCDPDLYITYGDTRLPSLEHYDLKSATFKSEILTLDLTHDFYLSNKLKSMRGPYILGVYGSKRGTYTLSVSQEAHAVGLVVEGQSVRRS